MSAAAAGAVHIIYGSQLGLSTSDAEIWFQGLLDVADEPEENDQFGDTPASGDFNADGYADLVIGVPYEDTEYQSTAVEDAGVVHILNWSSNNSSDPSFDTGFAISQRANNVAKSQLTYIPRNSFGKSF